MSQLDNYTSSNKQAGPRAVLWLPQTTFHSSISPRYRGTPESRSLTLKNCSIDHFVPDGDIDDSAVLEAAFGRF